MSMSGTIDLFWLNAAGDLIHEGGIDVELDTKCGCFCQADFDCDGTVGASDLAELLGSWGICDDCDDCPADFTGDCRVRAADLAVLLGNWGPCP